MKRFLRGGLACAIFLLSTTAYSQVLINENFSTATGTTPPAGWINNDLNSSTEVWTFNNPATRTLNSPISSPAAIFDSDFNGSGGAEDAALESPSFDASTGLIVLSFDHYFQSGFGGSYAVEVFDGTDWDTIIMGGGTSTSNPQSEMLDITALTGASTMAKVRFHWKGNYSWYWILDNVKVESVSCSAPTALGVTNLTSTSADLYWTGGGASDWNLEYGPRGFTPGSGTKSNETNDTVSLVGLTNGVYDFYVRDSCGLGNSSSWSGPFTFGLNSTCASALVLTSNGTYGAAGPSVGGGCYNCTNAATNANWYEWTAPGNGLLDISACGLSSTDTRLWIYSGSCASLTQVAADDDACTSSDGYASAVTGLVVNNGTTYYLEWDNRWSSSPFQFTLTFTAVSCPVPSALGVTSLNSTSASLYWTTGSASDWNVEYGLTGFTQGAGTMLNATNDTVNVTGLSANTAYEFYVRDSCGLGSVSAWSGPFAFTTPCVAISAPYLETFTGTTTPSCWSQSATSGGPWVFTGTPDFGNTYAMPDHTNGSTNNYAWVDQSGTDAGVLLTGPPVDVSTLTSPRLSYWVVSHNNTTSVTVFNILYAEAYNGSSWVAIDSVQGDFGLQWVEFKVDLTPYIYNTNLVRVRFRQESGGDGSDFDNDMLLDDIAIIEAPSCVAPSNLTASNITSSSADLSWTTGGATNWEVEYGPTGFTVGIGTRVAASSSSPYTLSGLSPQTDYDVYVRDSCGAGDVSSWTGPLSFTTPCVAALSGTYTINSALPTSGTNFNSFSDAATQLNTCGVSAPVTINVAQGTYTERVAFDSINGASSVNTITIQADAANTLPVEVTEAATVSADNYIIQFNNADWITIDGLTLTATGTSYSTTVEFAGTNSNITVQNCILNAWDAGSTSTNHAVVYDNTGASNKSQNITISGNEINNGSYGIYLYGVSTTDYESGHIVSDNNIQNFYSYGIRFYYQDGGILSGNTLASGTSSVNSTVYGIYNYYSDNSSVIGNNVVVNGTSTNYGIYCYLNDASASAPNLIANNMVTCQVATGTVYGIYVYNNYYTDVVYNTVNVTSGSATAGRALYLNSSTTGTYGFINLQNNNLVNTGGGYAVEVSSGAVTLGYIASSNYNNAYATGATVVRVNNSNYADLASYQVAVPTFDQNSVSVAPLFFGPTDLHVSAPGLNNVGSPFAGITDDIDGDPRSITTPDIGADEFTPPSCLPSSGLMSVMIYADSAIVSWNAGGGTTYTLEYGTTGFVQGNGTTVTGIVDTFYTITGLSATTSYDFYIQDDCGVGGTSPWTGPASFVTPCSAIMAPYTEGFENSGNIPNCWNQGASNSENWLFANSPGSNHIGNNGVMGGSTVTGNYFAWVDDSSPHSTGTTLESPMIDVSSLTQPMLRFYRISDNEGETNVDFSVEVWDGAAWNLVYFTDSNSLNGAWERVSVSLGSLTITGNIQVRFIVDENNGTDFDDDVAIDDVSIIETPSCIAPSALTAVNITSSAADLGWTENGTATAWDIELGVAGFTPTGTPTNAAVSSNPYTATGLLPSTGYEFYVRADCGGSGQSVWAGPFTFTTSFGISCVTGTSAPVFNEEFDLQGGWTGDLTSVVTNGQWIFPHSGTTTSSSTGPSGAHSGSNYTYVETSSNYGDTASLVSPAIDLTQGAGSAALSFYLHAYGANIATLKVGVSTSPSGPFTNIYTQTGAIQTGNSDPFTQQSASLNTYLGQLIYIEFSYYGWTSFNGDLAIDQVEVFTCLTCLPPSNVTASNITSSSVDLSWTSGGATNWEVEYGSLGFSPGSGTRVATTSNNPHVIGGLSANTTYDVYVRDSCAVGDVSPWVGPLTFTTLCSSQLSGTYSINSALPTAGTNFNSMADAIAELNDCGVSGQVTFNVAANSGPYAGGLEIVDVIGTSTTDTVVFNGNGNVLSSGSEAYILRISGTSYVTINDFDIINSVPTSPVFGIMVGNASQHLNITNNMVDVGQGYTSSLSGGIVVSGSATSATTAGNNAQYLNILNNEVIGGYYGITLLGNSSYLDNYGHTVADNIVRDFYLYGIYITNGDTITVRDNDINRATRTTVSTFYGVYLSTSRNIKVIANRIHDSNTGAGGASTCYPIYMTTSVNSLGYETEFINNAIYNINPTSSTIYGIYMLGTRDYVNMYHNTVDIDLQVGSSGTTRAFFSSGSPDNYDVKNNIFSVRGPGTGTKYAIYVSSASTSFSADNNVYYMGSTAGTNHLGYWGTSQTTLSDWQTATSGDANSSAGDPVFSNPLGGDLTPLASSIDNGGTPVGVLVDITGGGRSALTPDPGAWEFTGLSADIAMVSGRLASGQCPSANDSVYVTIDNVIGSTVDFSVNPLTVVWNVTGPVNSNGTIVINSGTLASATAMEFGGNGVNFSQPGNYVLNAYIQPNSANASAVNDTLVVPGTIEVLPLLTVNPKTDTIISPVDSITLRVSSPLLPAGQFLITEICHFKTATGQPIGGWPSYLTADDYIEITGSPSSDLGGVTLEQWSTTALQTSYTFPPGTMVGPNGTAIIQVGAGAGASSPSDFYYNGVGTGSVSYSSGGSAGRILKDANGNIMDAVGYSGYSFPAAANVPASEWSSPLSGGSSTSGIRLNGPDNNTGSNWIVSSSTSPQDPNTLNTNVPLPAPPAVSGFSWLYLGLPIDTALETSVGPFATSGIYEYVARYNGPCGIVTDTAVIVVNLPSCSTPSALGATPVGTTSADLTWTGGGAVHWNVEYGPVGFTLGTGTFTGISTNSFTATGLVPNLVYEFYVRDSCAVGDVSNWAGPFSFNPVVTPCDNLDSYSTGLVDPQSALINGWAGAGGDAEISTDYANSGNNSLKIHTSGTNAFSDVVAEVGVYNSGVWSMSVDLYVPATNGGYYNILHNYVGTGTNIWAVEVTLDANGTATVAEGTNGTGNVGTYSYTPGAWNTVEHIIDLDNDTAYIVVNGITTSVGWQFSLGSANFGDQFNAMNFYSTAPTGQTPLIYFDNFCVSPVGSVLTSCVPFASSIANDTICAPGLTGFTSNPAGNVIVYRDPVTNIIGASGDTLGIMNTNDTTLSLQEVLRTTNTGRVGPLTNISTLGFGNFTNGQWFTAMDTIRIDSMTVRANGIVEANLQIWTNDPGLGGTLLQVGKSFTTGSATADYQVEAGVVLTPGNYYMNINFTGGAGQLFRATGGAVYPYVLPGLMSIDSTNFAGPRIYYTFDMVVTEVCLGNPVSVTSYIQGLSAGSDGQLALCDNGSSEDLTTYLSSDADLGGTFVSSNAATAITGNMFNPSVLTAGTYQVYYTTTATVDCPADSALLEISIQQCVSCVGLTPPTLSPDTICGSGVANLGATGGATDVVWYNSVNEIVNYGSTYSPIVNSTTQFKALSLLSAGPTIVAGPPQSMSVNAYPAANFTNGQYITVSQDVRIDSAVFAVNGALDFVVAIQDAARTDTLQTSKLISFAAGDTSFKEIGIYLTPGTYFINTIPITGTGVLWRPLAGASFPYGVSNILTVDSSDFGPTRLYYLYDMRVSGACISSLDSVTAVIVSGTNAGLSDSVDVCYTTSSVDLATYLGTHDPGGTWYDDNSTGALTGSMFNVSMAGTGVYNFIYALSSVGGCAGDSAIITVSVVTGDAGTDSTITACITGASIQLRNYITGATGGIWTNLDNASGVIGGTLLVPSTAGVGTFRFSYRVGAGVCPADTALITVIIDPAANAGAGSNDTVCDTLTAIDLTTYLDANAVAGGTWKDVSSSGGLSGSTFNASAVISGNAYTLRYVVSNGCGSDSADVTLFVGCKIGLGEFGLTTLEVYPNPTSGVIILNTNNAGAQSVTIELYSSSGKLLMSKQTELDGETPLDISRFADGVYNLRITTEEGTEVHRISKM